MNLVLLGPPGAGKGTQAELLKETLKVSHISTGDIFREEMKNNTPLEQEIKKYVDSGNLVPDEVVTKIIDHKFTTDQSLKRGWLLDGFPRTHQQAIDLDKILNKVGQPIDYVLDMEATLPVITARLTGRLVCKKCGALFHSVNKPPKQEGVCDFCGGPVKQRADDNAETIKNRMGIYSQSIKPIVDYYQAQNKLLLLDGDQNAVEVHTHLMKVFKKDGTFDYDKVAGRN